MSTAPVILPDSYDAQPPLTEIERVVGIFVGPSKTFADIRRNRSWWLPYVLITLFGILFSATLVQRLGPIGIADSALRANPRKYEQFKELPADQQVRQRSIVGKVTTYSLYSFPVAQLILLAFTGLLLWIGFNFILGGSSTYPQMFAVAAFAALPGIVRAVLGVLMLFLGDLDTFDLQDPRRHESRLLPQRKRRPLAAQLPGLVRPAHPLGPVPVCARCLHRRPRQGHQRLTPSSSASGSSTSSSKPASRLPSVNPRSHQHPTVHVQRLGHGFFAPERPPPPRGRAGLL